MLRRLVGPALHGRCSPEHDQNAAKPVNERQRSSIVVKLLRSRAAVEVGHVSDIVLVGYILQMSDGPQRIRGKLWLEQRMLARDSFRSS